MLKAIAQTPWHLSSQQIQDNLALFSRDDIVFGMVSKTSFGEVLTQFELLTSVLVLVLNFTQ